MQYPLNIVSLDYRNRSERIFPKGGIGARSLVTHLGTSCHTLLHFGIHRGLARVLTGIFNSMNRQVGIYLSSPEGARDRVGAA